MIRHVSLKISRNWIIILRRIENISGKIVQRLCPF
jgi:hypothetical protein